MELVNDPVHRLIVVPIEEEKRHLDNRDLVNLKYNNMNLTKKHKIPKKEENKLL